MGIKMKLEIGQKYELIIKGELAMVTYNGKDMFDNHQVILPLGGTMPVHDELMFRPWRSDMERSIDRFNINNTDYIEWEAGLQSYAKELYNKHYRRVLEPEHQVEMVSLLIGEYSGINQKKLTELSERIVRLLIDSHN